MAENKNTFNLIILLLLIKDYLQELYLFNNINTMLLINKCL